MPLNKDSTSAYYNTRFIMSANNILQPIEWKVSKVETEIPVGINKLTLYQDEFRPEKDYYDEVHGWLLYSRCVKKFAHKKANELLENRKANRTTT